MPWKRRRTYSSSAAERVCAGQSLTSSSTGPHLVRVRVGVIRSKTRPPRAASGADEAGAALAEPHLAPRKPARRASRPYRASFRQRPAQRLDEQLAQRQGGRPRATGPRAGALLLGAGLAFRWQGRALQLHLRRPHRRLHHLAVSRRRRRRQRRARLKVRCRRRRLRVRKQLRGEAARHVRGHGLARREAGHAQRVRDALLEVVPLHVLGRGQAERLMEARVDEHARDVLHR
eukprot:scaffold59535_cov63-Phaeocystis_antarctica.AAC.1